MKHRKINDGYIIRLMRGEKIITSLMRLAKEENIGYGTISGIGAIKNTELGYYDLEKKGYVKKVFENEAELINITGSISWFEDTPVIHTHVAITGIDFLPHAGHLFEAEVAVTVEIFLDVKNIKIFRKKDPQIGLNLMDL